MKKYKPNTKYNPNEVDSGFIYSELMYKTEKYSEIFIKFRHTLSGLLIQKEIVTIPYNDETTEMVKELEKYWEISISSNDSQNKVDYFCFNTSELGDFITSYKESCVVKRNDEIFGWNHFDWYFALKLNLSDLLLIDEFLNYQLENYFKDTEFFKRFLDQIIRKYQNEFLSKEVIETVNTWKPKLTSTVIEKRLGRKPTEKIEIPIPRLREKDDKRTIFNKEDTAKLFSYLAQLKCIFNDKSEISNDSMAKAIQILTGFSAKQMEEFLLYEKFIPKNKSEAKK